MRPSSRHIAIACTGIPCPTFLKLDDLVAILFISLVSSTKLMQFIQTDAWHQCLKKATEYFTRLIAKFIDNRKEFYPFLLVAILREGLCSKSYFLQQHTQRYLPTVRFYRRSSTARGNSLTYAICLGNCTPGLALYLPKHRGMNSKSPR